MLQTIFLAFIVGEVEKLVLDYRSTDAATENVAVQLGGGQALALRVGGEVVEKGIRVKSLVANEPIACAVKLVGAGAGDEGDLCAGAAGRISVGVGGGNAEFLYGIERYAQGAIEGLTGLLVVDVYAVEGDVGLVATTAVDNATTVGCFAGAAIHGVVVTDIGDAGLQREDAVRATAFKGKLGNGLGAEGVSYSCVYRVELDAFGGDFNGLGDGADCFKSQIDGGGSVDQKPDLLN